MRFVYLFLVTLITALGGAACGDRSASTAGDGAVDKAPSREASVESAGAPEFFADLPAASEVAAADFGDLYFKLLTRVTVKIRAVGDEEDAVSAKELIAYARSQAEVLAERTQAMSDDARVELVAGSAATIEFAKSKYDRTVARIDADDPAYLREFAQFASKPWPSLTQ